MSQRRRRRAKLPVAPPPVAPPFEDPPQPPQPAIEEAPDVVSPAQSQAVAYGLTIAVVAMLLVCAVAVYIAAP